MKLLWNKDTCPICGSNLNILKRGSVMSKKDICGFEYQRSYIRGLNEYWKETLYKDGIVIENCIYYSQDVFCVYNEKEYSDEYNDILEYFPPIEIPFNKIKSNDFDALMSKIKTYLIFR